MDGGWVGVVEWGGLGARVCMGGAGGGVGWGALRGEGDAEEG